MTFADIKAIALDFDGTVVESVGIKDWAFRTLFQDAPDRLDEIIRYHLAHNAVVRFDKFRHITENILGKKYTEEVAKDLSARFSRLVFRRIVECPFVDGAQDFLDYFYGKIPLYVVTASPRQEFDRILDARRLKKYFKKAYAVPWAKKDALADIVSDEGVSPGEIVFIGDSPEDREAAQAAGVFFIGRDSNKPFKASAVPVYKDLAEIKSILCGKRGCDGP